ncbi:MAG: pitrilysin family protein [Raineya sp.]
MLTYEKFVLDNGLNVLVHQDSTTPIVAFNLLYNVGAKDEDENKTGFAHLFEHLMFGGSKHIPSYDAPLQMVGGENNAFTTNDLTNYYITLPKANMETAFWLESDRMLALSFEPEVLETQRSVVIEEFKQRYLNQPYGDAWLKLRPLAYQVHPYRWATIGKDISHIERATMEDVKNFFYKFYIPNNAYLCVAGDVSVAEVEALCKKWFEPIPAGQAYSRNLPKEPKQNEARLARTKANVPLDALYKAYKMPARMHPDFQAVDLLSDILGRGKSSRLYENLVRKQQIFNNINAYITDSVEEGLLVISGHVNQGIDIETANKAVEDVIGHLLDKGVEESELEKVKNKALSTFLFSEMELLYRAMNLCYFTMLGNTDKFNQIESDILSVSKKQIDKLAQEVLQANNCSTLFYEKM